MGKGYFHKFIEKKLKKDKLNGKPLKLVDQFIDIGSSFSSTENDVNIRIGKTWAAIDKVWFGFFV